MDLNQWFNKGITTETYMDALEKHKEGFFHVYNSFALPNDEDFFQSLKEKNLRVIILAEVWCGHCMFNLPVLFRLAEKVNMPVRILPRDENLELMDQYLTNGKSRTIPIFIFIDEDGNEVAKWGPRAEETAAFMDTYRKDLPDKEADDYDEKFNEMIKVITKSFREDERFWGWSYGSMKEVLTDKVLA